ncbi:MAG: ArsR family transcriptional regulator [Marinobacterium sp.]
MALEQFELEERRLVILRLLAEDSDYSKNSSLLERGLELYALSVSRDRLHTELVWLAEQGLITAEPVKSVMVVKLTQRGLDVSKGRAQVPGVKRPGPGA